MRRSASRTFAWGSAAAAGLLGATIAVPAQAAEEPAVEESEVQVQILGTNDFHGRILPDSSTTAAGAASMASAVAALEAEYPNSVFAAAGDLIGASTFESFISHDKPTIDVLNAMDLDVSAVGNHEFDKGYDDLVDRVMAEYDEETNPYGGASWEYLGANVRFVDSGDPALPETWIQDFEGVSVGFIGAVTDETPTLVSPDGIEGLEFEAESVAANRSAAVLKGEGADVVVLLVHEGAPTTAYADAVDTGNDFGLMLSELDPTIDAVISGHTHLAYDHKVPVQEWIDEGRAVTDRPVVSSGQYGMNLNRLIFTVDEASGAITGIDTSVVDLYGTAPVFPADPEVEAIVNAAKASATELGSQVLGEVAQPLYRANVAGGSNGSSRGAESTLGNVVAEVQQWATEGLGAQIAFMNPGGLRTDLLGTATGTGEYPSAITYKEAAGVQPFANTLVTMTLTGEQIEDTLEQQWQPGATRPRLHLGTSDGFEYTYDPDAAQGERILQMWLDDELIEPTDEFTVTVNSFLASGGDGFTALAGGTDKADSGRVDLQAMVDYLDELGSLGTDYAQHGIGVSGLDSLEVAAGAQVDFGITSLMMTGAGDLTDANVVVSLDGEALGTFPVTNTLPTNALDEHGTATVSVTLPEEIALGHHRLEIAGDTTATAFALELEVLPELAAGTASIGEFARVGETLSASAEGWPAGTALSYQWLVDGEEVDGETGATFTPSTYGSAVAVRVTGALDGHLPTSVTSNELTAKAGFATVGRVGIAHTARVGSELRVYVAGWDHAATLTYQWNVNGKPVAGATGTTFTPDTYGSKVSLTVTAKRTGYMTASRTSAEKTVAAGILTPGEVAVVGTAKVGARVVAATTDWPAGATRTYQWKADGKVIAGATAKTLKVPNAAKGKHLTVTVTAKKTGYAAASVTSAATGPVK